jgi:hypothetical protein
MFSNLKDEAWERAEECRREAARAMNKVDVIAWLSLADEWRKLSQTTDIDLPVIAGRHTAQDQVRSDCLRRDPARSWAA